MKIASLRTGKVMAIAAIAAGGLGAAVLPVSADVSTQSPSVAAVRVESPATLQARGAAIIVPITVVCTPGSRAFVSGQVSQNVGGSIASGNGSTEIPSCTGGFQTLDVAMPAQNVPFRRGVAFATARLDVFTGGTATDQREIRIVRPDSAADAEPSPTAGSDLYPHISTIRQQAG